MTYSDSQILETVNHKDKVSYKRLYDTYYRQGIRKPYPFTTGSQSRKANSRTAKGK